MTKNLVSFGLPNFFLKSLAPLVTRYYGQLSSCTISEKTNDPILRKLSDGWTDRWTTDGQMDKSDFIGCCPTLKETKTSITTYINNNRMRP